MSDEIRETPKPPPPIIGEGMTCNNCGGLMVRTGSCHTCTSCGNNTGCG